MQELYKDIVLHCHGADERRTSRSLMAISGALKRFEFTPRSLQLKLCRNLEFLPLKDLLLHLPAKSLQRLICCGAWPWERAPLFSLYMHLKSLRNLRLDRDFFFGYNCVGDLLIQTFDSITEICVEASNLEGMSCKPLDSMDLSSLRKLEVRIEPYNLPEQSHTFRDDVIGLNPFFSDHINRFHTVTHLTLWRISFSALENLELFSLPSLTHLALMYCEKVGLSLSAFGAPHLKSLHYFNKIFHNLKPHNRGKWMSLRGPDSDLDDLTKILGRFRGLETLAVRTGHLREWKHLADAILLHKDTLKFLIINDSHEFTEFIDRGREAFSFIAVALRCKKLSQVGLSIDARGLAVMKLAARVSLPMGFEMQPVSFSRWAFSNRSADVSEQITVFGHFEHLPRSRHK